jgi:hypothetical protein
MRISTKSRIILVVSQTEKVQKGVDPRIVPKIAYGGVNRAVIGLK